MDQLLKQMLLVCVFLFALTEQAIADSISDAWGAWEAGDYAKAAKLIRPLAEQGDDRAQLDLGNMYDQGEGVIQDYVEAVKWYRLAAEQGNDFAGWYLGEMYYYGKGVPQDFVRAHMWINIVAAKATGYAEGMRPAFINRRKEVAEHMTAKQIAEAQELAKKCTANKFKGC